MANNQENNTDNNKKEAPQDKTSPDSAINDNPVKIVDNKSTTNSTDEHRKSAKWKRPKTISVPGKESKATILSIGVNVIIAIAAFYALDQTRQSTSAAIRSANAADSTVAQQRRNDRILREESAISSFRDSINTEKRFRLDSISRGIQNKSVEAQIQTLKETQKQFEVFNEPFLQIIEPVLTVPEGANSGKLFYTIANVGKYPALLTSYKIYVVVDTMPNNFNDVYNYKEPDSVLAAYLSDKSAIKFMNDVELNKSSINFLKKDEYFAYISGYVRYNNLIKKTVVDFRFQLRLKPNEKDSSAYNIINDNVVIRKYK